MKNLIKYFNYQLFIIPLFISLIGILTLYSIHKTNGSLYYEKQLFFLLFAIVGFLVFSVINLEKLFNFSTFFYSMIIISLVYLILFGEKISGAKSWLKIGGLGIQPSEIGKIFVILMIVKIFRKHFEETLNFMDFIKVSIIVGIPVFFIFLQPDFGTVLTYGFIVLTFIFIFGLKRNLAIIFILLSMVLSVVSWNYVLKDYHKKRIINFLHPERDPLGYGYHTLQSKITIGSGGFKGKGYLRGTQKKLGFLPAQHTDFILSVFAEEFGFAGVSFVLGLFLYLFYLIYKIGVSSETIENILLSGLVLGTLFFHFLINVLVCIGKFPVAGITFPLFSYGGSSIITIFSMLGLVENVYLTRFIKS
jgi:rod shape determining protein RodA